MNRWNENGKFGINFYHRVYERVGNQDENKKKLGAWQ